MSPKWKLNRRDRQKIEGLSRSAGLHPLIAQLLLNRGIDEPSRAGVHRGQAKRPA